MNARSADQAANELGTIQIAPEVLEIIAGLASIEVEGVAGMSGGLAGGIAELLGRKNLTKGVKVQAGPAGAAVDVSIIVEYGFRIPEICSAIQRGVKHAIESMTGIEVTEVNVHIHDVHFKSAEKPGEEDGVSSGRLR